MDASGEWAISLNYARLRVCRPDYGYAGEGQDPLLDEVWPEDDGLWLVNLKTGKEKLLLSVADARERMPRITSEDGLAYFCFSHGAGTEPGQPDIPFGGERQEHHGSI